MDTITKLGIKYKVPKVTILQESGIGTSELAARVCYDSFSNSEHKAIQNFDLLKDESLLPEINDIQSSELLDRLAWVTHHHSVIEHASLTFMIEGTSRGVLQEHARHRIQSISVRSTRYTMDKIVNAFIVLKMFMENTSKATAKGMFYSQVNELDMFVVVDAGIIKSETDAIYDKLSFQFDTVGENLFLDSSLSKDNRELVDRFNLVKPLTEEVKELIDKINNGKKKRNVGDAFKHIVSDIWAVDMVITFNLRSLKNYFDLRRSGAAYFLMEALANTIHSATPEKYLALIDKEKRVL